MGALFYIIYCLIGLALTIRFYQKDVKKEREVEDSMVVIVMVFILFLWPIYVLGVFVGKFLGFNDHKE